MLGESFFNTSASPSKLSGSKDLRARTSTFVKKQKTQDENVDITNAATLTAVEAVATPVFNKTYTLRSHTNRTPQKENKLEATNTNGN